MFQTALFGVISFMMFYYFALTLQWYSYKIKRVVFNFSKPLWHVWFLALPLITKAACDYLGHGYAFSFFVAAYFVYFALWFKKLDKKLVFTERVKRFVMGFSVVFVFLFAFTKGVYPVSVFLVSAILSYLISLRVEQKVALGFENTAKDKLDSVNPVVVAITASFGKTSIKNFLAHILSASYKVYPTPASVNTKIGIIKDINEKLPSDTQIYIVEAGARAKGDIAEIARLVSPHYSVIGKIGEAHIEYFKTLDNIRATKSEILASDRLKKAFSYENVEANGENIVVFGYENGIKIFNAASTLNGVSFELEINGVRHSFEAPNILGSFNAINITAAILVALEIGMDLERIKEGVKTIPSVPHRLQKIVAGGKIILDDSFNGNFDGIKEGIELCKTHAGQKTIVTCGLVESRDELNIELAKIIDDTFDLAIITGELNKKLFEANLKRCEAVFLKDKNELQNVLATQTYSDSIVYFANDAPGYI